MIRLSQDEREFMDYALMCALTPNHPETFDNLEEKVFLIIQRAAEMIAEHRAVNAVHEVRSRVSRN